MKKITTLLISTILSSFVCMSAYSNEKLVEVNEGSFVYESTQTKTVKIFEEINEEEAGLKVDDLPESIVYNEKIINYYAVKLDFEKYYSGINDGYVTNIKVKSAKNEDLEYSNCNIVEGHYIECDLINGEGSLFMAVDGGAYTAKGVKNIVALNNGKGFVYDITNILEKNKNADELFLLNWLKKKNPVF